ncbi:hypothetical protein VNI00_013130 [Paramarasmius palmivorus]|uniref:Uncharacterized protein n=1 Tax=Paramarasmius palmivorus TaxID=297713 RepID=A0AAW0B3N3_9AGAR
MISSEDDEPKPYVRRRSKTTSTRTQSQSAVVTVTAKKRSKSSPTLNINLCSKRPPPYSTSASTSPLTPLTPYSPLTPLAPISILPISMPLSTPMTRDDSEDDDDVLWHAKRSNSTGSFHHNHTVNGSPPQYQYTPTHKSASNSSLRARIFSFAAGKSTREKERLICTKPGEKGAGETETEVDEPPKHLPTARSTASLLTSTPHHHQRKLEEKPLRFLYQCFRLLAVVPAFIGVLWCVLCIIHYDDDAEDVGSPPNSTPMPLSNIRPPHPLASLLPAPSNLNPSIGVASDMLASNADNDDSRGCGEETGGCVGGCGDVDVLFEGGADLGYE